MNDEYDRFAPDELAVVLSHYDLGVIESAKEFRRGSRRAPKLLLTTVRGRFILKRRAEGKDDPFKVAFAHALVGHLRARQFPVPALVGTRDDQNSMLQLFGHVYEVFEYVEGERYDASLEQTTRAGSTLAAYHEAVEDFDTEWNPPVGNYHDSEAVRNGLNAIPTVIAGHDSVSGCAGELLQITQHLYDYYDEAARTVNQSRTHAGLDTIIHGDWHPGNMLFRDDRVVAVLDFEAARRQPRMMDVASGMLQFSILRGDSAPDEWPDYFDETRMRRFLAGYLSRLPLLDEHRHMLPHLMIESLIAEAALPIAMTGGFGRLPGFGVLRMVHGKVRWLRENAERFRLWLRE